MLRVLLICASLLASVTVIKRVRKAKLQIDDAVFWVLFSISLLLAAVFPRIIYVLAHVSGVQSPANLLYLLIIGVLIVKIFLMSIKISDLESKIKRLVQALVLDEEEH